MSILDIKERRKKGQITKTILVYLMISGFAVAVDKIYALYGHGVSSECMKQMFLYPLAGGAVFYLLVQLFFSKINYFIGYRLFFNIYNSGIALLTAGSFLRGVMEIAGTDSPYLRWYYIVGSGFIAVGLGIFLVLGCNYKRIKREEIY